MQAKTFALLATAVIAGAANAQAVRSGEFPTQAHSFHLSNEELGRLYGAAPDTQ